jgi:thioesterase domain-containing protein
VIYTSGSTGQPKGIVAPHRGLINRCRWMWEAYPFAPDEICCQKTSLGFVDSVWEIFGPLLRGLPLVIIPDEAVKDPTQFISTLANEGVTRVVLVPSLLRLILETQPGLAERLLKLKLWISSGEALDSALVRSFYNHLPDATLLNLYGSSEVAGDVTYFDTRQPIPVDSMPIGRPIANTQIYILGSNMSLVPIGLPGEIFVGGGSLALGYLNRPDLTSERFVPNPFSQEQSARLYKTGDQGRYLPDGNILYLGRRDRQIKIRGMRVELDEIEALLNEHPAVQEAVVLLNEHPTLGSQLAAYVVFQSNNPVALPALRTALRQQLPEHMVPTIWTALPVLPYTASGKIDRQALVTLPLQLETSPHPPTVMSANEAKMARLWAGLLGRASVGMHDNFFDLGGHSLLAARLLVHIKDNFDIDLPLITIFRSPTIAGLTKALTASTSAVESITSLVPLQPNGTRRPFFCIHPLGGGVGDYITITRHFDSQQPFYALRAKGLEHPAYAPLSIEELATDYIREIRTVQPSGPYRLGGYSSGGLIAFEMARQLREAGEAVELVALLDSYAPKSKQSQPLNINAIGNVLAAFPHWFIDFISLRPKKMLARLRRRLSMFGPRRTEITLQRVMDEVPQALPDLHRRFMEAHYRSILAYQPQPYSGRVTLFRARAQALSRIADPHKGWDHLALEGVELREFSGSHHTLLIEPSVGHLAEQLVSKLRELD